ncbi:hypothetical protein [Actinocorallia herbida]|uniref:hypothetical protein n=1 Tax=Actinocorallia herbida TaxID=58109 RepID=UPI000F4B0AC4|nr:hypothetical protein [Actinocorallia herbida]
MDFPPSLRARHLLSPIPFPAERPEDPAPPGKRPQRDRSPAAVPDDVRDQLADRRQAVVRGGRPVEVTVVRVPGDRVEIISRLRRDESAAWRR